MSDITEKEEKLNYVQIIRFSLILERLQKAKGKGATKKELLKYVNNNTSESNRRSIKTIERSLDVLIYDFEVVRTEKRSTTSLESNHSGTENLYFISEENETSLESLYLLIATTIKSEMIQKSVGNIKSSIKHIEFDSEETQKGIDNVSLVLDAIEKKHVIDLTHLKFNSTEERVFRFKPYMLKEYQHRWYVLGVIEGKNEFSNFGFERISKIETVLQNDKLKDISACKRK